MIQRHTKSLIIGSIKPIYCVRRLMAKEQSGEIDRLAPLQNHPQSEGGLQNKKFVRSLVFGWGGSKVEWSLVKSFGRSFAWAVLTGRASHSFAKRQFCLGRRRIFLE